MKKRPRGKAGSFYSLTVVLLLSDDVDRLKTFRSLLDIKIYCLAFCQCFEAITVDCREMYEYIFTTIGGSNKTKTLGLVEPFNSTCSHVTPLMKIYWKSIAI